MRLCSLRSMMLALLLTLPVIASAQATIDFGSDLTAGYTRFLVYPHLQKAWESMQRGNRDRALAEFERARSLAPDNASVALQLAAAYRKFGETERAESLLRGQLTRTPDDARLRTALTELRLAVQPPAAVSHARPAPERKDSPLANGLQATASGRHRAKRPALAPLRALIESAQSDSSDPSMNLRAGFTLALQAHRFDDAQRQADALLAQEPGSEALLDELTYKLVDAGATEQATRALFQAYPFVAGTPAERDTLLRRLTLLIEQRAGVLDDERLLPLRDPLDTPALRSRQAALWAGRHDCAAVRVVLGDMSPDYVYDDWMRLGDCLTAEAGWQVGAPSEAATEQAYARAHALQPGGRASRGLAYQAHAAGDYRTAFDAWRSIGAGRLQGDELLAAVTTALAAQDNEQAANWLDSYRERGVTLDHRYWSLVAQSAGSDTAAATAALERAIELHPEVDDYQRLARLEPDAERQARFLELAAELDGDQASTQAALAFAYLRAGRPDAALRAFERAAALDPDNVNVQIGLGTAYWGAGRNALAQEALERAWHSEPTNLILTQQLVYVHQRLKHNEEARWYAEHVLDASSSPGETAGTDAAALADRRFGFQRLHEDLGRRVTINLDGFSGTGVGTGTNEPQAGSHYRSYSQFEADFRLGNPPVRDGRTLSAYVRVLSDGGDLRRAVPSRDATLGVGLRWKPWRSQVIYLAAENQNGLEYPKRRDFLLRASASFLNGGRYSDDWHPSGSGWFSRNLYLDAADYLETNRRAFTADYRASYHRKVSTSQTLEPYGHLQVNGVQIGRFQRDVRSGVGVRWNVWEGATWYDAAPHKVSVGVEFQQAFETYLSDRNGLFLTLGVRW